MDSDKQALNPPPSAPAYAPNFDPDTFYPPQENPPPYSFPDPVKYPELSHPSPPQSVFAAVTQSQAQPPPQIIQIVNTSLPPFGPNPARINCPYCLASIQTKVTRKSTALTHTLACALCCLCCCCFAWIPYHSDCLCDLQHDCPNCHKYLGMYNRRCRR